MDEATEEYSFAAVLHVEPDGSPSMEHLLSDGLLEAARSGVLGIVMAHGIVLRCDLVQLVDGVSKQRTCQRCEGFSD